MAVTIKNFNDLENFVRMMAKSNISELDDIARLMPDFMHSMPQKISAAKNGLRPAVKDDMSVPSRQAKGRLRMLEEAENIFNNSYEQYAEAAVNNYIATKGLSVLHQAKESGAVSVSDADMKKLEDECRTYESRYKNRKRELVDAYGVLEAMIDGRSMEDLAVKNYQKYGFFGQGQATRDRKSGAVTCHFQVLRTIHEKLEPEQHALMYGDNPLAAGEWIEEAMQGMEPLKLAPEKAVLCLDKTEMNGEKLSINNYKRLLQTNPVVANAWAEQCFDNMIRTIYNESELQEMEQDGRSPLEGVHLDGKPLSEFFDGARKEDICRLTADALLKGGRVLTVCRMEKSDGAYKLGEPLKTEVETKLPEKVSLWHRLLRKLGIEKTQKEKMTSSDLQIEESVEKINSARLNDRLQEKIDEYLPAIENNDRVCFMENAAENGLGKLAVYTAADGSQESVLTTLDRSSTRGSLATLYMIGSGMSINEALSADPALEERKRELGKQFLDTLTIPDREKFAQEKGLDTKAESFESTYLSYCADKEKAIIDTYNNVLYNGLCTVERSIAGLDITDSRQLIAKYPAVELCVVSALDYEQSIAPYERDHPEDAVTKQKRDYANAMKGYACVATYCEAKAEAFSPRGIAMPDKAVHALMLRAGAERIVNALSGKTLAESSVTIAQMNEFKGMNDAVRLSGKLHLLDMDAESLANMHGHSLDAISGKAPVPPLFAKFIDNALNDEMRHLERTPLPTTPEKFTAQFDNPKEAETSAKTLNANM